jgi:hypothetical protein
MRAHDENETIPSECAVCPAGLVATSPEAVDCSACFIGTSRWSWAGSAGGQVCKPVAQRLDFLHTSYGLWEIYILVCG